MSYGESASIGGLVILFLLFLIGLYMLPSMIAIAKRNNVLKVLMFNIFLGWTFVLWILCFVWACRKEEKPPIVLARGVSPADELKKYKDLLDAGAISAQEFEAKKNQLLGGMQ